MCKATAEQIAVHAVRIPVFMFTQNDMATYALRNSMCNSCEVLSAADNARQQLAARSNLQTDTVTNAPRVGHHCLAVVTTTRGMSDLSSRQICENAVGAMTAQVSRQGMRVSHTICCGETHSGASQRRGNVRADADGDK